MKQINFDKYNHIIDSIKRKRRWVLALTIIAMFLTAAICSPFELTVLDEQIILREGLSPFLIILFVVIVFVLGLIIYSAVSLPMFDALDGECDPEKHLVLNIELNKQKNMNDILCTDYFYLGEFLESMEYAEKMANDRRVEYKLAGCFNKARNYYFLNDAENLKTAVSDYKTIFYSAAKLKPKQRVWYETIDKTLDLLSALTDGDKDKIRRYRDVNTWHKSEAQKGYINYLKGVTAYSLAERKEAVYYFMCVKENCEKTFLHALADEYLQKISL